MYSVICSVGHSVVTVKILLRGYSFSLLCTSFVDPDQQERVLRMSLKSGFFQQRGKHFLSFCLQLCYVCVNQCLISSSKKHQRFLCVQGKLLYFLHLHYMVEEKNHLKTRQIHSTKQESHFFIFCLENLKQIQEFIDTCINIHGNTVHKTKKEFVQF